MFRAVEGFALVVLLLLALAVRTPAQPTELPAGLSSEEAKQIERDLLFPRLGDWAILKVGPNAPANPSDPLDEEVLRAGFFDERWLLP